jgi:Fe-S oxidoreductase
LLGIAPKRNLPLVFRFDFDGYLKELLNKEPKDGKKVALFIDEFTRYTDPVQGRDAIDLLYRLGYSVTLFYADSGRSFISKGFLEQARKLAFKNVSQLDDFALKEIPVIGLEPSSILTFRDEYTRMGLPQDVANRIAANAFLIEEFIAKEAEKGLITKEHFTKEAKVVKVHNHCYQKALSNQKVTFDMLSLPENYTVTIIPSGCCGMAGSFGYEKEHYDVSMQVGGLKLFPAIQKMDETVLFAENGTSCRHQIYDGTGKTARHPVSILKDALWV